MTASPRAVFVAVSHGDGSWVFFFFCLALQDGEEKSTHRDGKQILKALTRTGHTSSTSGRRSVCKDVCVEARAPLRAWALQKNHAPPPPVCVRTPLILNFVQEPFKRGTDWEVCYVFAVICYPALLDRHSERRGCRQGAMGPGPGEGGGEGGFWGQEMRRGDA